MNEQQIRALIKSEIQQAANANRFQLASIPRHIHNGIDSPTAFQPILTYVGMVGVPINTDPVTVNILPTGWTVRYDGTGSYAIVHNLGTVNYITIATCAQSTNVFGAAVVEAFPNEVSIAWGDISTGTKADTGFVFTLTMYNNKRLTVPSYYGDSATTGIKPV